MTKGDAMTLLQRIEKHRRWLKLTHIHDVARKEQATLLQNMKGLENDWRVCAAICEAEALENRGANAIIEFNTLFPTNLPDEAAVVGEEEVVLGLCQSVGGKLRLYRELCPETSHVIIVTSDFNWGNRTWQSPEAAMQDIEAVGGRCVVRREKPHA